MSVFTLAICLTTSSVPWFMDLTFQVPMQYCSFHHLSQESLGPQGDPTSPEYSLEGLMLKLKLQYLATWCEELTHLKRCWERWKAGGEVDDGGWDGWMASLTQWTWVWVNSGSWWRTGRPWCCSPCCCGELDLTDRLNCCLSAQPPWPVLAFGSTCKPRPDLFLPLLFFLTEG